MYFCPVCSSLLVAEQSQQIQLCCPACPYTYRLSISLSTSAEHEVKALDGIMGGEDDFKYGNKCTVRCPACPNEEALFMELQTRSADEPTTIFYKCTKCRFNWKE